MRKDEKSLESLKIEDTREEGRGGQRTLPPRQLRRRVKVAREGCREERVTKDPNSTKRGPEEEEGKGDGSRVAERVSMEHMEGQWCGGG